MQLSTSMFGPVAFTLEDVILLQGEPGSDRHRRWLLLADAHHPALFWLQSLDDVGRTIATVAASPRFTAPQVSVPRRIAERLGISRHTPPIILVPLTDAPDGCQPNNGQLILINPQRRIGHYLCRYAGSAPPLRQSLQTSRPRKVA